MKEENGKVSDTALVEAVFKKMSWLEKYFRKYFIKKVSVRVIDSKLLRVECGYTVTYDDFNGDTSGIDRTIRVFDKDGLLLGILGTEIIPEKKEPWKVWRWSGVSVIPSHKKLFNESVEDALKRFDPDNKAYYVVCVLENDLIISKPAGTFQSINESITAELKLAEKKLDAMLA